MLEVWSSTVLKWLAESPRVNESLWFKQILKMYTQGTQKQNWKPIELTVSENNSFTELPPKVTKWFTKTTNHNDLDNLIEIYPIYPIENWRWTTDDERPLIQCMINSIYQGQSRALKKEYMVLWRQIHMHHTFICHKWLKHVEEKKHDPETTFYHEQVKSVYMVDECSEEEAQLYGRWLNIIEGYKKPGSWW